MAKEAYVGLGSNLGDTEHNLALARQGLAAMDGVELVASSPVYLTEPQEYANQPWFANQVVRLRVSDGMDPVTMLSRLMELELALGRKRVYEDGGAGSEPRFGPRTIDLDLLLFGGVALRTPELILPHPRMRNRAFVLVPLRDIAPDLIFPDGTTLQKALQELAYTIKGNAIHQ